MWYMLQNHLFCLTRQRFLASKSNKYFTNIVKNKPSDALNRYISQLKTRGKSSKSGESLPCSPWKLCTGVSLAIGARYFLYRSPVFCKAVQTSRVIQRRPNFQEDTAKFDWEKLLNYLKPHKWLLIAAVGSALAVAFLNVYIPAMLGVIVNVLAGIRNNPAADFIDEIKMPAFKLISLYVGQAAFTFFYIHLLSQVGEKVATQMKQDLFVSILRQDIEFFDKERTGELVNRLTVDVQDFKSSFKQTISGGLRAITQQL